MDDQQKTDKQPGDSPIEIMPNTDSAPQAETPVETSPVNDLTPPPAAEEAGIAIEVKTDTATPEAAPVETVIPEIAEAAAEDSDIASPIAERVAGVSEVQEATDVVAAPAEASETEAEPTQELNLEDPVETVESAESTAEAVPITPSVPIENAEPAVVGVAASQMKAGQAHPHRNNRRLAAVVVIIVALLLAGTAVFVYLSANGNTEETEAPAAKVQLEQSIEDTPTAAADSSTLDTQYKNDAAKLTSAVNNYAANNNGQLPAAIDSAFVTEYLETFNDPDTGNPYIIVADDPVTGEVQYKTSSTCDSSNAIVAAGSREIAVRVPLSDGTYHCLSN